MVSNRGLSVVHFWNSRPRAEVRRGHCQVGSLAGAAHLLNDNTGDPRSAQSERKSLVEFKGKS